MLVFVCGVFGYMWYCVCVCVLVCQRQPLRAICVASEHLPDALYNVFVYALHHWPRPSFSVVVDGSDSDEKPLKGSSLCSLNGDDAVGDSVSRDSMVDYADGGEEFDEDGSFIGEYSGRKHGGSVSEPSGPNPVTV